MKEIVKINKQNKKERLFECFDCKILYSPNHLILINDCEPTSAIKYLWFMTNINSIVDLAVSVCRPFTLYAN